MLLALCEMDSSLDLLAATTNRPHAVLKIVPKFVVSQVALPKSNSCK